MATRLVQHDHLLEPRKEKAGGGMSSPSISRLMVRHRAIVLILLHEVGGGATVAYSPFGPEKLPRRRKAGGIPCGRIFGTPPPPRPFLSFRALGSAVDFPLCHRRGSLRRQWLLARSSRDPPSRTPDELGECRRSVCGNRRAISFPPIRFSWICSATNRRCWRG